jgi:membrane protein YdbS with pleckstrin-like domain
MTLEVLTFAVALVAAVLCGRYYVLGVLEEDRPLARFAAAAVLVFGAVAVVVLMRILRG